LLRVDPSPPIEYSNTSLTSGTTTGSVSCTNEVAQQKYPLYTVSSETAGHKVGSALEHSGLSSYSDSRSDRPLWTGGLSVANARRHTLFFSRNIQAATPIAGSCWRNALAQGNHRFCFGDLSRLSSSCQKPSRYLT
jgi:hypothetical protein